MRQRNKTVLKKSGDIFMKQKVEQCETKVYHIYAKDKCLFHSIKEEEFKATWKTLRNMVGLMKTDYIVEDLSYEELTINKELSQNSSY